MNDYNIDSQSKVILLKEMTKLQRMLIMNRTLSSFGVDDNTVIIVIFKVIVLVVNGPLFLSYTISTRIFI